VENLFKKQSVKFIQNRSSFMKIMVKHILVFFAQQRKIHIIRVKQLQNKISSSSTQKKLNHSIDLVTTKEI